MLTVHADEGYLLSALKTGARGYVLKSSVESEIVEAVRAVSQGKAYFSPKVSRLLADDYMRYLESSQTEDSYDLLTARERQILQLLAEGSRIRISPRCSTSVPPPWFATANISSRS